MSAPWKTHRRNGMNYHVLGPFSIHEHTDPDPKLCPSKELCLLFLQGKPNNIIQKFEGKGALRKAKRRVLGLAEQIIHAVFE